MARRPWLILLFLPLVPLWHAVVGGKTIGPWDQISVFAPWMSSVPNQPWDVLQADGALQFYVWRDLVFESWRQFEVPFWNPYPLAGTPLLANSQSGALYPLHIAMGILHVPTPLAVTLLAWIHLAWASLGVFALTRRLGASAAGALLAGASFGLTPFMVGWVALASVVTTVSWIPWVLLFCLTVTDRESRSWRTAALLAISVGMMLLAGHLQFCAYGMLAAAIVIAARSLSGGALGVGRAMAGLILGVFLAAPQLLPVLEYSKFSHRRNTPDEAGYAAYVGSAIRPFEFGNLVNPIGLGNPRQMASGANVATYWVPIVKPGANFAESAVSPGAVVLAFLCLLPLAWRKARHAWPVGIVGLVGLALATGTPLAKALYFLVPGWSSTGSPGRAIVLFVLAACVFGGLCVGVLEDDELRPKTPKFIQFALLGFVFLVAGTLGLGITGAKTPEGMDHNAFQALVGSASATGMLTTLMIAVIAVQPMVLGYFRRQRNGPTTLAPLVVAGAVAASMIAGSGEWVSVGKPPSPPPMQVQPQERAAFINGPWDLLLIPPANFPPNLATLFRVREAGGYDSLMHRETVSMLKEVNGGEDPAPAANGNIMFVKRGATDEALAEAGVSWRVTPAPEGADPGKPVNWRWQRIEGPGRLSGVRATIIRETSNRIEIQAEGPGRLVLRDRMMAGWRASVDGRPTPLAEGRWRELDVPEGSHTVTLEYTAPGYGIGLGLLCLALLVCLTMALVHPKIAEES